MKHVKYRPANASRMIVEVGIVVAESTFRSRTHYCETSAPPRARNYPSEKRNRGQLENRTFKQEVRLGARVLAMESMLAPLVVFNVGMRLAVRAGYRLPLLSAVDACLRLGSRISYQGHTNARTRFNGTYLSSFAFSRAHRPEKDERT